MERSLQRLNLLALLLLMGGNLAVIETTSAHTVAVSPVAQVAPVQVTGIQLEETEAGLQIRLESTGELNYLRQSQRLIIC